MAFCLEFDAPTSVQLPVSKQYPPTPYGVKRVRIEVSQELFLNWRRALRYNAFVRKGTDEGFKGLFLTSYPFQPTAQDLEEFLKPYLIAQNGNFLADAQAAREAEAALDEIRAREEVRPWSRGGVQPGKRY